MFRPASLREFKDTLAASASPALAAQLARFVSFDRNIETEAMIQEGDLKVAGSFRAPALCTLIVGNLDVDGVVDLQTDFDEGGLFIVLGNVSCRHFIGEYGKCTFIDGDIHATDSFINGFSDSSMVVIGTLRTLLFIGCDIWAEVGAGAAMDYGVGYCLPIGYTNAEAQAITPHYDEGATARIVVPDPKPEGYLFEADPFADLIRAGRPIFR